MAEGAVPGESMEFRAGGLLARLRVVTRRHHHRHAHGDGVLDGLGGDIAIVLVGGRYAGGRAGGVRNERPGERQAAESH